MFKVDKTHWVLKTMKKQQQKKMAEEYTDMS